MAIDDSKSNLFVKRPIFVQDGMAVVPRLASFVFFNEVVHDAGFRLTTCSPIVTREIGLYIFENVLLNL